MVGTTSTSSETSTPNIRRNLSGRSNDVSASAPPQDGVLWYFKRLLSFAAASLPAGQPRSRELILDMRSYWIYVQPFGNTCTSPTKYFLVLQPLTHSTCKNLRPPAAIPPTPLTLSIPATSSAPAAFRQTHFPPPPLPYIEGQIFLSAAILSTARKLASRSQT